MTPRKSGTPVNRRPVEDIFNDDSRDQEQNSPFLQGGILEETKIANPTITTLYIVNKIR